MVYRWQDDAECKGKPVEIFLPSKRISGSFYDEAKQICDGCSVKAECLDFALSNGEDIGVWGGMSPRQRFILKRALYHKTERERYDNSLDSWLFDDDARLVNSFNDGEATDSAKKIYSDNIAIHNFVNNVDCVEGGGEDC